MGGLIWRWLLNAVALLITARIIEGIRLEGLVSALTASLILGIVNAFIRPLVILLTLPLNILTLGLFTWVINGLMLKIVSTVVAGFNVEGFWAAVVGALVLSLVSGVISFFLS
ncbi:phage holin family protein [Calderihabitans maritimus]|uniref:Phage holin family protein n=1 Tax=Calderihabitans maritimus TaxID=1246530 RepID=A0A1Z5HV24_9FIRM|nr:phage holin family protein [Calderihabitans maritimus]GAW93181.1 hypothetical protein Sfum_0487 [Calderihabitans maritimus]